MRERRIAGAENATGAPVDAELRFECAPHIDFGQHAKSLVFESRHDLVNGGVEWHAKRPGDVEAHGLISPMCLRRFETTMSAMLSFR